MMILKKESCTACEGDGCSECCQNGFLLVEAAEIMDFVIRDGSSKTQAYQDEIKNQGGRWDRKLNGWRINDISKDSGSYDVLRACGLRLFGIIGTER